MYQPFPDETDRSAEAELGGPEGPDMAVSARFELADGAIDPVGRLANDWIHPSLPTHQKFW